MKGQRLRHRLRNKSEGVSPGISATPSSHLPCLHLHQDPGERGSDQSCRSPNTGTPKCWEAWNVLFRNVAKSKGCLAQKCKLNSHMYLWCPRQAVAGPPMACPPSRSLGRRPGLQPMPVAAGARGAPAPKPAANRGQNLVWRQSKPKHQDHTFPWLWNFISSTFSPTEK